VARALLNDLVDFRRIEHFLFEQCLGKGFEGSHVLGQHPFGPLIVLGDQAFHFVIDLEGDLFAEVATGGDFSTEEDFLFLLAEGQRAQLLAHTPLAHHLARQVGGPLDVVSRAS